RAGRWSRALELLQALCCGPDKGLSVACGVALGACELAGACSGPAVPTVLGELQRRAEISELLQPQGGNHRPQLVVLPVLSVVGY
ncbi:unnamed protein product, partial [Polarella glacialis]